MQGTAKLLRDLEKLKAKTSPSGEGSRGVSKSLKGLCATTADAMRQAYDHKVTVRYALTNEGATITATHPSLGFIEFGTGIRLNHGTEYGKKFGFTPASWSKEHEQWLTDPRKVSVHQGFWPLGKKWVEGAPPADAFGVAEKMIRELAMKYLAGGFG